MNKITLFFVALCGILNLSSIKAEDHVYTVAGQKSLCGSEWDCQINEMAKMENGSYQIVFSNVEAGTHEWKICQDKSWDIIYNDLGVCTAENNKNAKITTSAISDITITFDGEKGTATSPAIDQTVHTYSVIGSENLCGVGWQIDDTSNDMTYQYNNVYIKNYILNKGTYEFKITKDHDWNQSWGLNGGSTNVSFTVGVDNDEVSITFNCLTNQIGLSYTQGESYNVAGESGLCGVAWDPSANKMDFNSDSKIWEITFKDIPAGTYAWKVCANGNWEVSYNESGICEGENALNASITTNAKSDITIEFDGIKATAYSSARVILSEHTYTVAGNSGLCGNSWDPFNISNDLTKVSEDFYTIVFENIAADTYEFKIVEDHSWAQSWGDSSSPTDNASVTVVSDNSKVTINFVPSTGTISTSVEITDNIIYTQKGEISVVGSLILGELNAIFSLEGENVTSKNGDLEKGLYIVVDADNRCQKVLIR